MSDDAALAGYVVQIKSGEFVIVFYGAQMCFFDLFTDWREDEADLIDLDGVPSDYLVLDMFKIGVVHRAAYIFVTRVLVNDGHILVNIVIVLYEIFHIIGYVKWRVHENARVLLAPFDGEGSEGIGQYVLAATFRQYTVGGEHFRVILRLVVISSRRVNRL